MFAFTFSASLLARWFVPTLLRVTKFVHYYSFFCARHPPPQLPLVLSFAHQLLNSASLTWFLILNVHTRSALYSRKPAASVNIKLN